jgi:hypothetical protein
LQPVDRLASHADAIAGFAGCPVGLLCGLQAPPKIHDAALTEYLGQAASAFSRWSLKSSSTLLLRDCHDGTLVMSRQRIGFLSQQPSPVSLHWSFSP